MQALFLATGLCLAVSASQPGVLVIVGGGAMPEGVRQTFIDSAGGDDAIIAVLPQASQRPERGKASVAEFLKRGVADAYVVELENREQARNDVRRATAIWFPGGSQLALYKALANAGLVDLIHERHRAGIAIGGSSAGAAIMSEVMIPTSPQKPGLVAGNTPTTKGLGLTPQFIIDQHFVERHRMNRLLSAVIDHPDRIGIGIGESTAIVIRGSEITVQGKGNVVVIDGRNATGSQDAENGLQSSSELSLHVLRAGQQVTVQPSRVSHRRKSESGQAVRQNP